MPHHKRPMSVFEHPYYVCLRGDNKKAFEKFMKRQNHHQRSKSSGTWKGLNALKKSLEGGFDRKLGEPVEIKKGICMHGRHRMCIIALLYPDADLVVRHRKLRNVLEPLKPKHTHRSHHHHKEKSISNMNDKDKRYDPDYRDLSNPQMDRIIKKDLDQEDEVVSKLGFDGNAYQVARHGL